MKYLQDTGIDIFSAVQRQQRKSDVMTSFGLTACSAVYYHAGSSLKDTNSIDIQTVNNHDNSSSNGKNVSNGKMSQISSMINMMI
jgi:hypothetical protein